LLGPSEHSDESLDESRRRDPSGPCGIGFRFRGRIPEYGRHCFGRPASPLDLSSAVRCSSGCKSRSRSNSRLAPLVRFSLPLGLRPTQPSPSTAVDGPLSWAFVLYSTCGKPGPHHAGQLPRLVPPSGFGYPLDGLLPGGPCRFYFTPAALMRFALRSFPLPQGFRPLPDERTHMPFLRPRKLEHK
jgi:hypothetical protein